MKSRTGMLVWLTAAALAAGMAGGLLSSWLIAPSVRAAQPEPQILTAREIRLVDEQGNVWARLGSSSMAAEHRGLILNDQSGKERLRLAVSNQGNGGLVSSDAQGRFRAALTVSSTGLPGVTLTDRTGALRFLLHVDQEGSPQMDFYDSQGRIGLGLEVSEEGNPKLRLSQQLPEFGVAVLDATSLAFHSEEFRRALLIGADGQKGGRIQLFDSQGEVKADLPASQASSSQQ